MNVQIVDKGSFEIVGKARKISTANGENFKLIPAFWGDCMKDGTYNWVRSHAGRLGVVGLCKDLEHCDEGYFTYMIGVERGEFELPVGFESIVIPATTWAIFESIGPLPDAIQDVTRKIFSEWLPSSGYQHGNAPELEVYTNGDSQAADYRCEVWIPIRK